MQHSIINYLCYKEKEGPGPVTIPYGIKWKCGSLFQATDTDTALISATGHGNM